MGKSFKTVLDRGVRLREPCRYASSPEYQDWLKGLIYICQPRTGKIIGKIKQDHMMDADGNWLE